MITLIKETKQRFFPKGLRRFGHKYLDRILRRVPAGRLYRDLSNLGIGAGDFVCVHCAMSQMGYVPGGAETIINVLRQLVGPQGHLMMPSFSGGHNTFQYVSSSPPPFNPRVTPSKSGTLSEVFRKMESVTRSLHPTHSVTVEGPEKQKIVSSHHKSKTPFGDNTPFDHFVRMDGKVLLLNVNANSLLHRIEEQIDWPNNYLEETFCLECVNNDRTETFQTKVHTPGPSHFVVLETEAQSDYAHLHIPDYALPNVYPEITKPVLARIKPSLRSGIVRRNKKMYQAGIVRDGSVGYGVGVVVEGSAFADIIRNDFSEHLSKYHRHYRMDFLHTITRIDNKND